MGNSSCVVSLIKFVKEKEHALTFLRGNLFCKPWVSFKDIEDKQRGDRLELAASKLQTQVYVKDLNRSYNFWLEDGDSRFAPVFCMYHVSSRNRASSKKLQLEDERLKEFGHYGVVIKNVGEFIDRLNRNLPSFSYGLIEYVDYSNLAGANRTFKNPILQKDISDFKHQREFRIYNAHFAITNSKHLDNPTIEIIQPNEFGASLFSIGDISDIAEIRSMDELFLGVEINIQNSVSKNNLSKDLWWDGENYREV